jgi:tRNA threonylcarbamoyladenosine biosynthesis protein TsaB
MTVVLGFDTATHATVVGLRLAAGETLQARDDPPPQGHPGHATRLLAMAEELLSRAKLGWSAVERVAVGLGPGRFTGLRVGLATARGLAQSLDAELVGVSTLRALGLGARGSLAAGGADHATIAVVDARRGEVFAAAYPAGDADEIAFEHALSRSELESVVDEIERRGGSAGERWQAVGDGALVYQSELRAAGVIVPPPGSPLHLLDAAALCDLGAEAVAAASLEVVLPDYRRAPDAALARGRTLVAAARGVDA